MELQLIGCARTLPESQKMFAFKGGDAADRGEKVRAMRSGAFDTDLRFEIGRAHV